MCTYFVGFVLPLLFIDIWAGRCLLYSLISWIKKICWRTAMNQLWSAVHLKNSQLWGQLHLWSPCKGCVPLPLPFFTCCSTLFVQLPAAFSVFRQDHLALQYHRGGPAATAMPGLVLLTHAEESSYCWGCVFSPLSPSTLVLLWLQINFFDSPVKNLGQSWQMHIRRSWMRPECVGKTVPVQLIFEFDVPKNRFHTQ